MDFSIPFFKQQPIKEELTDTAHNEQLSWEDNYFGCWSCNKYFEKSELLQLHNEKFHSTSKPKHSITPKLQRNIIRAKSLPYIKIKDTLDQQLSRLTINKTTDETTTKIYELNKLASKLHNLKINEQVN